MMTHYARERIVDGIKGLGKKLTLIILLISLFLTGCCVGYIYEYRHSAILQKLLLQPEPESCALCDMEVPYHAPCLIDLSTGEVLELRVYDAALSLTGHINTHESGTMSLNAGYCANLLQDTTANTCTACLKENDSCINGIYFCYHCRGLLSQVRTDGYVIADIYHRDSISIYPVESNEKYTIRDYTVEIDQDGLKITVYGHLHEKLGTRTQGYRVFSVHFQNIPAGDSPPSQVPRCGDAGRKAVGRGGIG